MIRVGAGLLALLLAAGCGGPKPADLGPTTTASPTARGAATGYPGGTAHRAFLTRHHWINTGGKLFYAAQVPDERTQAALCGFLFGEPEEVARVAGLVGRVTLATGSGYYTDGTQGTGFGCVYDVNGTPALQLQIWNREKRISDRVRSVVQLPVSAPDAQGRRLWGASGYAPGYTGGSMSAQTAQAWLTRTGARVSLR